MYDAFASLPQDIRERIKALVDPPDPESWVRTPIEALGNQTFLDAMNGEGGPEVAKRYFERLQDFEQPKQITGPEDLGSILHFDAADLSDNRAGFISKSQRRRFLRRDILLIVGSAACLIGGTAFNIALLVALIPFRGRGVVLGLALWIVGGLLALVSGQLWLDLAGGRASVAEGILRTTEQASTGRYGGSVHYFLEVAGQRFEVPRAAYDQVREGIERRIYYLPKTKTVLSVDPV